MVIGSLEPDRTYGVNIVAENQIGPSPLMQETKFVVTDPNGVSHTATRIRIVLALIRASLRATHAMNEYFDLLPLWLLSYEYYLSHLIYLISLFFFTWFGSQ